MLSPATADPEALEKLTKREEEVLGLLITGQSNRSISRTLAVSERTIKAHITRILEKLGVQSRLQAALTVIVSRWRTCSALSSVTEPE